LYAGLRRNTFHRPRVEVRDFRRDAEVRRIVSCAIPVETRQSHFESQNPVRTESHVGSHHPHIGVDHESGTDQQHQSKGHFCDDQDASYPLFGAARSSARALF
jgi:hypothetical protein